MDHTYWHKQGGSALFPDILWNRPENKSGAGKLCIIGGNQFGFGAPGAAYASAVATGAGVLQVVLPEAIRKVVGNILPDAAYAASNPSGSFAKNALIELISQARWADHTLLAGDLGRNSETAVCLESFVQKYTGALTITQDSVDFFKEIPLLIVDRKHTNIVVSLSQLQKLFIATPSLTAITHGMSTVQLVEALHEYTSKYSASIITAHGGYIFAAISGKVSTTKFDHETWQVEYAAKSAVFIMQHAEDKQFESITTAVLSSYDD